MANPKKPAAPKPDEGREIENLNPPVTADNAAPASAEAEKPAKETKPAADEGRRFVYVGPSLPGGVLKSNTILRGSRAEIEAYLADALEKYPQAAKLIVPVAKLAEAKAKLQKPDNAVKKCFDDVSAAITKKSKEE